MGGSPLNNEVWRLDSVAVVPRLVPTTRAMYLNTTHETSWTFLGESHITILYICILYIYMCILESEEDRYPCSLVLCWGMAGHRVVRYETSHSWSCSLSNPFSVPSHTNPTIHTLTKTHLSMTHIHTYAYIHINTC